MKNIKSVKFLKHVASHLLRVVVIGTIIAAILYALATYGEKAVIGLAIGSIAIIAIWGFIAHVYDSFEG